MTIITIGVVQTHIRCSGVDTVVKFKDFCVRGLDTYTLKRFNLHMDGRGGACGGEGWDVRYVLVHLGKLITADSGAAHHPQLRGLSWWAQRLLWQQEACVCTEQHVRSGKAAKCPLSRKPAEQEHGGKQKIIIHVDYYQTCCVCLRHLQLTVRTKAETYFTALK